MIFLAEHSGLSHHNFKEPGRKTESPVKHAQNRAKVADGWTGATLQYSKTTVQCYSHLHTWQSAKTLKKINKKDFQKYLGQIGGGTN